MNPIKMGEWEFTEQELARQLVEAAERGKLAERTEARADRVYYDGDNRRLVIELRNRVLLGIPVNKIQGLATARPDKIAEVQLMPSGDAVRWDNLDLDLSIPGLVAGTLGTNTWMTELGRMGGSVQSEAKAIAARENGLKGGRPLKTTPVKYFWVQMKPQQDNLIFAHTNIGRTNLSNVALSECNARLKVIKDWSEYFPLTRADLSGRLLSGADFIGQTVSSVYGFYEQEHFVIGRGAKEAANNEELALAA